MEKSLEEWQEIHQTFELDYHVNHGINWCSNEERFQTFWNEIRAFVGPYEKLLDIGCGPRPPFANSSVIEPLAEKYQEHAPSEWWEGIRVYNQPAERKVPRIKFDTVVIWNCIDHTYNWQKIIDNINGYLKDGGHLILATDFHEPTIGHPGVGDREKFIEYLNQYFTIVESKENFQERDLALKMKK